MVIADWSVWRMHGFLLPFGFRTTSGPTSRLSDGSTKTKFVVAIQQKKTVFSLVIKSVFGSAKCATMLETKDGKNPNCGTKAFVNKLRGTQILEFVSLAVFSVVPKDRIELSTLRFSGHEKGLTAGYNGIQKDTKILF
jgi:hypothetical protein